MPDASPGHGHVSDHVRRGARRRQRHGGGARRQPSHEEIAAVAYQRYLSRGAAHGQDCDDWLAAERELSERHGR